MPSQSRLEIVKPVRVEFNDARNSYMLLDRDGFPVCMVFGASWGNEIAAALNAPRSENEPSKALAELVRLKNLHDRIEAIAFETMDEYRAAVVEYNREKPKAWGAARTCLEPK